MSEAPADTERAALRALAAFLGRLLVRELDRADLARLRDARLAEQLRESGLELPAPEDEAAWLDERAADYHDCFLGPEGGPLVQSLWTDGRYEGAATVRVRQLAEAAALELDRDAARGAPPDQLGCLLLLWAEASERAPAVADELAAEHLRWAHRPLARVESAGGFYGSLATLTRELIDTLAP